MPEFERRGAAFKALWEKLDALTKALESVANVPLSLLKPSINPFSPSFLFRLFIGVEK